VTPPQETGGNREYKPRPTSKGLRLLAQAAGRVEPANQINRGGCGDFGRSRQKHHFATFSVFVYDIAMNNVTTIPIESFTVAEKLLLMERLWQDLSKQPSNVAPPEWHGDVLAARLAAVKEGRTEFVDWDVAKERLRNRLK
jgi:putative addiction module component (TIGR02574 family)